MLTVARGGLIERRGVTAQLAAGLEGGSVLVIAGAGYGKTTAVRQALDGWGGRVAWVRCGDAGADAGRLFALLLDAVRAAAPGAADALAEEMADAREPVDQARAAGALERELTSVLVEPLVIVFDDAEALGGSPALDVIARLLLSDSQLVRVVVVARRSLRIALARGLAAGRISELRAGDLAFSAEECAALLRNAIGHDPEPAAVDALVRATDGWPLGVALAASGREGTARGPSPSLAHQYFEEEVFAPLQPELRAALLAGSLAPDLEVAELAGLAPPGGFADAIDRHELFVRSLASAGSPELHPLFREFLRGRFISETALDVRRAVSREIARALDELDRPIEAVDYHLSAHDWEAAAAAVGREAPALVRTSAQTVRGWLEALPAEQAKRPGLRLLAGELAHGEGRFAEAIALCRSAVDALEETNASAQQRFAARFALADVLMAAGDLAGAARLADVLEDADATGNVTARAVAVVAAAALARQGRFAAGRSLLERSLDDPAAKPLTALWPTFAGYYLELPAGRLDDALVHAREAVAMLEVDDPTGRLPYALTYLMAILDERGEDGEALEVAQRTREQSHRVGLSGWVGVALAIRSASLRVRAGDAAGAERDLAEVPAQWAVWGAWELDATRAAIAALRGDGPQALAAADRAVREARARWPYFDRARCAALLAPVLADIGHGRRAREIVEETLAERLPGFSAARLNAVLAWLLDGEGDTAGSTAALAAAWREAQDHFEHTIRREWPRVERPLWTALEHGAIDVDAAVQALAAAQPGASALRSFMRHPVPAVRRAALLAAVAAGHPESIERVRPLLNDPDVAVAGAARAAAGILSRTPPALSFRLLGAFELRRGTWLVEDAEWDRRVAQRVVRLLLCRGGGPVLEDELVAAFWPDKPADAARRSVQVAVSAARAVLDPPGVEQSRLLTSERSYRLRLRERDTVDAEEFERAAAAALAAEPEARRSALSAAAALWGGEPLPEEHYAEWSTLWRERLTDRYAEVLAALSAAHEEAGEMAQAISVARQLVALDPLNEAAHGRLIVAFARTGRRGHALRQFLECRRALVGELGVEPSAETVALQKRLLAGETI